MTLRRKTILLIIGAFIPLVCALYLISHWAVLGSLGKLQEQLARKDGTRVLKEFECRLDQLQSTLVDWAQSDETIAFVNGQNPEFGDRYLNASTLANLNLSFMLFLSRDGRLLCGRALDHQATRLTPLPPLADFLTPSNPIMRAPAQGYALLDGKLLLAATQPILGRDDQRTTYGTLVAGRFADQDFLEHLRVTTHCSVSLRMLDKTATATLAGDPTLQRANAPSTITLIRPDEQVIVATAPLADIDGRPLAVLRVSQLRKIEIAGHHMVHQFLILALIVGIASCLMMAYLIKRMLLSRLERLDSELARVTRGGDPADRIVLPGTDEFARLAIAVNGMLDSLMQTSTALQQSQEELVRANDTLEARVQARTVELARANSALTNEITERQRIETALFEASRRKDEFLAMLAHELRNPLAPVRNAIQIMGLADNEEVRRRQQEIINRQVSHMARLLDDLLDVGRITQGKIRLIPVLLDLRQVVDSALEAIQGPIREHGHTLLYQRPPEPVWISGDSTRLEQVLLNLLNNAVKYTEGQGTIRVSIGRELDAFAPTALIRIRDTGIGIAPDFLPHVFGLFVQADRSLDRTQGGLGIGLTLVDRLIQMHGGSVQATSEGLGLGSEFVVRLPLMVDAIGNDESLIPADQLTLDFSQGQNGSEPVAARVLVVDDNTDTARSMGELLEMWGYQVRVAFDGSSAIEVAGVYQPEVILLDIGLPGMNGFEVARSLRSLPAFASTLLVALTGYSQDEDRQAATEAGFDRFLTKPVDLDELRRILEGATIPTDV